MKTSNGSSTELLNVGQLFKANYVVPLYQRNFAWTDDNISRLLDDIAESIKSNEQNLFIGNLVVIQRPSGDYEVIDGQQRLTTLALLSSVLHLNFTVSIHYDSRPEVEKFLNSVVAGISLNDIDTSVSHYDDAFKCIISEIKRLESQSGIADYLKIFSDYVREHVCLVREVVPEDTDVAEYFEIMNNRGEQLQEHEIVKGLLLEKLKDKPALSQICSVIWDACSQMDERIQKCFPKEIRKSLFGDNYDILVPQQSNYLDVFGEINTNSTITKGFTLDEVLDNNFSFSGSNILDSHDEEMPEVIKEDSIIDFPNFLMHVLRLYYNGFFGKEGIPLHDKYLLNCFRAINDKIDSSEFIYRLLRCRTIFDRYVVKVGVIDGDEDEGRVWSLRKAGIYINDKTNRSQLRFYPTFADSDKQDMIIKGLSCIQVGHPSRYYKNYLQNLLSWFIDKDSIVMSDDDFLKKINDYMLSELQRTESSRFFGIKEHNQKLQGTNISNHVLDYIDYLIWNLHKGAIVTHDIQEEWFHLQDIKDFRFQYWNSVEHHYPQKRQKEIVSENVSDFDLDCLGNVFLVSKSANSRLSDKNPADKAILYSTKSNLAPNRQLVYAITSKNGWSKLQIENHLKFIEFVYKNAAAILQ